MPKADSIKITIAEFAVVHYDLKGLIGLGSGTTIEAFIQALGKDLKSNPKKFLNTKFISSSVKTETLARQLGFTLFTPSPDDSASTILHFYIDGLDQVDSTGKMIKGKGGALTREKILCESSEKKIFLCDSAKMIKTLTSFLPIEIIPFAYPFIKNKLREELKIDSELRMSSPSTPFLTDNGNWTLDLSLPKEPGSWGLVLDQITSLAGVVETGYFTPNPYDLVVGYPDGKVEILKM